MTPTDLTALSKALAATRAESASRARQIDDMLRDEPWECVAQFAAGCAQSRSLGLMPWQTLPMYASLAGLRKPFDDPRGERESAELLKKLLAHNLSRYEPDPLGALEQTERQAAK